MAVVEDKGDEGEEVTVDDTQRWAALNPKVGGVIEVNLASSSYVSVKTLYSHQRDGRRVARYAGSAVVMGNFQKHWVSSSRCRRHSESFVENRSWTKTQIRSKRKTREPPRSRGTTP